MEVGRDPAAQVFGLPDVDDFALGVLVQVHAWVGRDGADFLQEIHESIILDEALDGFVLGVLHYCQMSNTITIRLSDELLGWLERLSEQTGLPIGRLIRQQLESAKAASGQQRFLRHAGVFNGPPDLSSRKGYSRK